MEEVIQRFNERGVRYLVIGGQAMRLEGMPRFSMDWDVFLPGKDSANLRLINELLPEDLDIPVEAVGPKGENLIQTYQTRWGVVQFHLGVPGLPPFAECERRSVLRRTENGVDVRCVCGADLLLAKKAANRPQDQQDIAFLEKKKEAGLL